MCDRGVKPKDNRSNQFLNIKFIDQVGREVQFRVQVDVTMDEIMALYSFKVGIRIESMRFFYNGQRLSHKTTAKNLGMADDATIEVYQKQTGG